MASLGFLGYNPLVLSNHLVDGPWRLLLLLLLLLHLNRPASATIGDRASEVLLGLEERLRRHDHLGLHLGGRIHVLLLLRN